MFLQFINTLLKAKQILKDVIHQCLLLKLGKAIVQFFKGYGSERKYIYILYMANNPLNA